MKCDSVGSFLSVLAAGLTVMLSGCSARDPETRTPVYHVGTPTNRSSVNSWELYSEPYYTQPGVNGGMPVAPPPAIPSERGFEPYDEIASNVYQCLLEARLDVKYISVTANKGVVILDGSADNATEKRAMLQKAAAVYGVVRVRDGLTVAHE